MAERSVDPADHAGPYASPQEHPGVGRVVRWDAAADSGAVVVDGVPAEVLVPPGATAEELAPGDIVELRWRHDGRYHRATAVRLVGG